MNDCKTKKHRRLPLNKGRGFKTRGKVDVEVEVKGTSEILDFISSQVCGGKTSALLTFTKESRMDTIESKMSGF